MCTEPTVITPKAVLIRPMTLKLWKLLAAHPVLDAGHRTTLLLGLERLERRHGPWQAAWQLLEAGKADMEGCPLLYVPWPQTVQHTECFCSGTRLCSSPVPSCHNLFDAGGSPGPYLTMGAARSRLRLWRLLVPPAWSLATHTM